MFHSLAAIISGTFVLIASFFGLVFTPHNDLPIHPTKVTHAPRVRALTAALADALGHSVGDQSATASTTSAPTLSATSASSSLNVSESSTYRPKVLGATSTAP